MLSFNDRINLFYHVQDLGIFAVTCNFTVNIWETYSTLLFKTYHLTKKAAVDKKTLLLTIYIKGQCHKFKHLKALNVFSLQQAVTE